LSLDLLKRAGSDLFCGSKVRRRARKDYHRARRTTYRIQSESIYQKLTTVNKRFKITRLSSRADALLRWRSFQLFNKKILFRWEGSRPLYTNIFKF
jgi:hypothetical protein